MEPQISLAEARPPELPILPRSRRNRTRLAAPDLGCKRLGIVNVIFVGLPGAGYRALVLVDAGLPGTAGMIARAAARRFARGARPAAILLTHAHFDHVGALKALAERWDVPVYAHLHERPYLDGSTPYPPPDPTVGGGLMATLAPLYPRGPVDVTRWLQSLPDLPDADVPGMPGWRWLHTPGHTPGHVSFWRQSDRTLLAGDAFITTNQESAYAVAVQCAEVHAPPSYYTPDWTRAEQSVQLLARLDPDLVITGHGPPMRGPRMRAALHRLARDFRHLAVPDHGRYVEAA